MSEPLVDALGRRVALPAPPQRIVSLVPSETESALRLVGSGRIVGRTTYCEHALDAVAVGGTKDPDVAAVVALAPDLVLANKEENGRKAVEAMIAAGLPVHVSFPQTAAESVAYLEALARLLGVPEHPLPAEVAAVVAAAARDPRPPVRVFVPIWKDPWMTFDGRTFASDVLELAGGTNVFADRPRRYPLAADLGRREALPEARVGERDTRYPRTTLEEIRGRRPTIALLPDEPYAFTDADAEGLSREIGGASARVTSGKDLFWYGVHLAKAIAALRQTIALLAESPTKNSMVE
ncbi:MAG: helical backbone metal receptor [Myxococcota bacterium]